MPKQKEELEKQGKDFYINSSGGMKITQWEGVGTENFKEKR